MVDRRWLVLACFLIIISSGVALAQTQGPATPQMPDITGDWSGTWGNYSPAQGTVPPKDICKSLNAKVEHSNGTWLATFEGDCGRPYKYVIKMEGRQVGKVVMFKGTTDLGQRDGGIFDWIGRANEKEFVGFFTSAYYTGTFSLSRTK